MVILATVTLLAHHIRQAMTSAHSVIAELCSHLITVARLAVLGRNSVTEEEGLAEVTGSSKGVVQTELALSSQGVTALGVIRIDITRALTRPAHLSLNPWIAKEASGTTGACRSCVSLSAVARDEVAIL